MDTQKFMDCERNRLEKITNFRLPHYFYTIGIVISVVTIIMMFVRAFAMVGDTEWLKHLLQKTLLIGMLFMSIARDNEEDELTIKLRMQSYAWAFITGVIYTLVMPYVEFGVSNVVNNGGEVYKDLGDFQILIFMLMIQLMSYHTLKRYR
jgi:magnesium-transporting ATPase (P-type)